MNCPLPTLLTCIGYLAIVKYIGPKLMAHRPAFQLRPLIIAYNLGQVLFSSWMFNEFGQAGWFGAGYSFKCQPVDYSVDDPLIMRMVRCHQAPI